MPTVAEIKIIMQELHTKRLINLDASIKSLLEVEGLSLLSTQQQDGVRPLWHAVGGSSYCIVTRD
jgi:hypothetical protein